MKRLTILLLLLCALGWAQEPPTTGSVTAQSSCTVEPTGDGCNTCTRCGGKLTSCTLMYCEPAPDPPEPSVPCSCTGSKGSITSYEVESESACSGMAPLLNESAIRDRLIAGGETWVCNIATSGPPEPSEVSSDVLQFQALLADAFKPQNEIMADMLKVMQQQAAELKALREQVEKQRKGCKSQ